MGYKDYEDLAEEVIRSQVTKMNQASIDEHPPHIHESPQQHVTEHVGDELAYSAYIMKENTQTD
jgi:hypothetical protein